MRDQDFDYLFGDTGGTDWWTEHSQAGARSQHNPALDDNPDPDDEVTREAPESADRGSPTTADTDISTQDPGAWPAVTASPQIRRRHQPWYRHTAAWIAPAAVAATAVVVSILMLVLQPSTTPSTDATTPAPTPPSSPAAVPPEPDQGSSGDPIEVNPPLPPPPPPEPTPVAPQQAPRYYPPAPTKAPQPRVSAPPSMSFAPKPVTPPSTATPGGNGRRGFHF